ncbi:MAG TPA: RNA polymerase factor sigma-54 [bacterium]|nr:RNA polymerase factor sigma-54 [bacterium]HQP98489.1 RNA polymerase factor sigma-54 [bacterium]
MEQRLQLHQKMQQRLIMTPQMQQSIQLLQLSSLELTDLVQQEMVENPLLEEHTPGESMDSNIEEPVQAEQEGDDPVASLAENGTIELDSDWEDYFSDSSDMGYLPSQTEYISEDTQPQIARPQTLKDHLIWQLGVSTDTPEQYRIGEYLIDQLDENGFLPETITRTLGGNNGDTVEEEVPIVDYVAEMLDVPPQQVREVLVILQGFDPAGIAARNVIECLKIQCRYHGIDQPEVIAIIEHHLPDLERRRLKEIGSALNLTEEEVQEIADLIATLDPWPGRQFAPQDNEYISPDVFVELVDGEYQVRVNDDGSPPLRISRRYRQMLENREDITAEEYEFIRKKFQSAVWLIRNIEQRKRTLYRVTKAIVERQHDFFEEGITALKPLKLRDIADELGIHEATVCRVVNKKYVQTPRGLFELKFFFSTGLQSDGMDDMSAKAVMEILQELIEKEDPKRPFSDQKLTDILHKEHKLNIARRTVAKYREKLGILSTSKRRRV